MSSEESFLKLKKILTNDFNLTRNYFYENNIENCNFERSRLLQNATSGLLFVFDEKKKIG